MADGLVIKHPTTGQVIFNSATVTSHVRATVETNGGAGSLTIPELVRGAPFIIQALPSTNVDDTSESYNMVNLSISGDQLTWSDASGPMRVVIGSRAIGSGAGSTAYAGLVVRRDGGVVQVSSNDYTMQLSSYGSLILTPGFALGDKQMTYGSVTVAGVNPVLAFRAQDGRRINMHRITRSGGQTTFFFRSPSSNSVGLIYWAFDTANEGSLYDTDAALVLKDKSGVKAFDSRAHVLNIVDVVTQPNPTGFPPDDDNIRDRIDLSSMQAISTPAGRTYAVIQATPSHIDARYVYHIGTDVYGEPIVGGSQRDIYFSTAQFSASGEVYVGFAQFYGNSSYKGIEVLRVRGDARHTIIDVTNLPSAAMPNPSDIAVSVSASVREISTQSDGSANTISPASVANASGGTAPYSYLWQYVSGSTLIAAYDVTSSASFRTQSLNQPAGETRETVWRCRVTDAAGRVGYSQPVTFRHVVERIDYVLDPVNWIDAGVSVPGEVAAVITNYQALNGITHPIRLRFVWTYTGNLTAGSVNVHSITRDQFIATGPRDSGQMDVVVNPGEEIALYCDGNTAAGVRSGQWVIDIHNEFNGGTRIDTVHLNLTVDSDNNYNVVDYTPDPIAVENLTLVTNEFRGWTNLSFFQITGTTHPITLRFTRSNNAGNASSRQQYIYTAPSSSGPWTLQRVMGTVAPPFDITVAPGTWFYVQGLFETQSGRRDGSWNMTLTNQSDGDAVIASWSVSGVVDNDNDYNIPDYTLTPGAISFYNNDANSTNGDVSTSFGGGSATGINQAITLTAVVSPVYRGGSAASVFAITVGPTRVEWGNGDTSDKSFSFVVQPGAYVGTGAALTMFPGSGDAWAYFHVDVFNSSTGEFVSGFDGGLTTLR